MKLSLSLFLGLAASMASAQDLNIIETAVDAGTFETLVTAVTSTGLDEPLSGEGPFTVFAPSDAAFAVFPPDLVECLIGQTEALRSVLLYHVVAGEVLSTDLMDGMVVPTLLEGPSITIDTTDGVVLNGNTAVEAADILTSNGVIHQISGLLIPPELDLTAVAATCVAPSLGLDIPSTAAAAGTFPTLVAALTAAELIEPLSAPNGPFTVFAPTEDAFAALPEGLVSCLLLPENEGALSSILTYHVVTGSIFRDDLEGGTTLTTLGGGVLDIGVATNITVNDSNILGGDLETTNGIIHVIDAVLVPETIDVAAFLESCPAPSTEPPAADIAGTAVAAGVFETLVAALTAADLVGAVSEPNGPLTVFAPTDDAFAALPEGLVACLLEDTPTLSAILTYHVVSGQVLSTDLMDGMMAETLQGESVTVDLSDGVKINDSTVTTADVTASNGVIHIIDSVLVPPSVDVAAYLESCAEPVDDPMDSGASSMMTSLAGAVVGAMAVAAL